MATNPKEERKGTQPVSLEKRKAIVRAYQEEEGSYQELAKRFEVGRATVVRFVAKAKAGNLEPTQQARRGPLPLLDEYDLDELQQAWDDYSEEGFDRVAEVFTMEARLEVSPSTLKRALQKLGLKIKRPNGKRPRPGNWGKGASPRGTWDDETERKTREKPIKYVVAKK